ncbi:MAG: DNA polymerase III subunit alpha [Alphaproteobacteria bacterium]|nr:DNA polymerase III subunit alpha [Alphaproteobacteria bacterium]MBQ9235261.1 DNA polymerase III subunit alpha [Alphaproteobacteria bacterium]
MEPKYIPLRVHTAYSLSEGAMKVPALVKKLSEMGVPAFAMTDTANMFGGKAVSKFAADAGIKPILGCQFNLRNPDADDLLKSKGMMIEPDKIVLLVMNETGYMNIMHLMKLSYLDNPSSVEKAFIRLSDLAASNEGLIALSGGVEGQIGRLLLEGRCDEAWDLAASLKEIFGNRFYMEIARLGLENERKTEDDFLEMAYKLDIPLVATNEAFFFDEDMYEAHDALVCIARTEIVSNENRFHFSINNRLKSEAEMLELFKDLPEALNNTVVIAKRCNYLSKKVQPLLPIFVCPDGMTQDEYITKRAYEGLQGRMEKHVYFAEMTSEQKKEIDDKYYARLEYELSVIKKMGFPGYFLIVSDFITWSKNHGVPVGPGRGSGAGSIVAWSLHITELDPIKLDLLFERFLNPERVNMPDFDVDFCQENRYKTIEYVQEKYGADKVAQIITYGKLQSKAVIKDVARVLGMPYSQGDRISKMIPAGSQGKNPTLQEALDQVPELEDMRRNDPQINKLFDIAMKLEGLYRNSGMHAAGVVIGDRSLEKLVPLYKDPRADMPVTQYDMKFVEETGLIKFDFLGLKTLTVIQKAVDWVKKSRGIDLNMDELPLDDRETYEMLQRGDTSAVFQFESPGMRDVHRQIKPDRFEDLIAIVSLYRPGPMDNIPTYIKRKHKEEQITYLHPDLAPILDETYGIMVYQEQVMKIAQVLGGYTLGGADKLRKVMGKKLRDEIPKQRAMFTEGALKKGIDEKTATQIFDQMEKFASYGFNKSHAAAYSLISYQTAYLKAHYPVEFMCAIMSLDLTNVDKLLLYKEECRKMGIKVLQPDINKSLPEFAVEDGNIRYALAAVKSVGAANMEAVVAERERKGAFKDISDFIHRIDARQINRKQLEQLIKAGAFDGLDKSRGKLIANLDLIVSHIVAATEMKNSSQNSLFGIEELAAKVTLDDKPDWPELEKLQQESEAIGFYLSAHPLDSYREGMERLGVKNYAQVISELKVGDNLHCKFAGCVNNFQKRISKNGNKFAFLGLSDGVTNFDGILFADALSKYEDVINSGQPLLINATLKHDEGRDKPSMLINTVEMLDTAIAEVSNGLELHIDNISAVNGLKQILSKDGIGKNKIYIIPENDTWDIRIALSGGYALYGDITAKIRALPGISKVKEL